MPLETSSNQEPKSLKEKLAKKREEQGESQKAEAETNQEKIVEAAKEEIKKFEQQKENLKVISGFLKIKDPKINMRKYAEDVPRNLAEQEKKLQAILDKNKDLLGKEINSIQDLIEAEKGTAEIISFQTAVVEKGKLDDANSNLRKILQALDIEVDEEFSYDQVQKLVSERLEETNDKLTEQYLLVPEQREEAINLLSEKIAETLYNSEFKVTEGTLALELPFQNQTPEKKQAIEIDRKNYYGREKLKNFQASSFDSFNNVQTLPEIVEIFEKYGKDVAHEALIKACDKKTQQAFETYRETTMLPSLEKDLEPSGQEKMIEAKRNYSRMTKEVEEKSSRIINGYVSSSLLKAEILSKLRKNNPQERFRNVEEVEKNIQQRLGNIIGAENFLTRGAENIKEEIAINENRAGISATESSMEDASSVFRKDGEEGIIYIGAIKNQEDNYATNKIALSNRISEIEKKLWEENRLLTNNENTKRGFFNKTKLQAEHDRLAAKVENLQQELNNQKYEVNRLNDKIEDMRKFKTVNFSPEFIKNIDSGDIIGTVDEILEKLKVGAKEFLDNNQYTKKELLEIQELIKDFKRIKEKVVEKIG